MLSIPGSEVTILSREMFISFRNPDAVPNVPFLGDEYSLPRIIFSFNLTHQFLISYLSIQVHVLYVNSLPFGDPGKGLLLIPLQLIPVSPELT